MKTVLLMGIGGVYNYGCEAIVRGTAASVRAAWPGARVVYASPRPADDRMRLRGVDLEVVPRPLQRYSTRNIVRTLCRVAGIEHYPCVDSLALLKGVSTVLSIGGDIYTLKEDGGFDPTVPAFGDAAVKRGATYILWGASVGPFEANVRARRYFRQHLARVSLIAAREPRSMSYLGSLGITHNVRGCPDPAFSVAPELCKGDAPRRRQPTIAINLSPLSLGFAGVSEQRACSEQAQAIEEVLEEFGASVVLVPHVVCDSESTDDDLRYLRNVRNAIRPDLRRRVDLLDSDPGFIGAKQVLVCADLVIAARMHCAINAISAHVPTVFLAYSQKAFGMCEVVYESQDWVMPVGEFRARSNMLKVIASALERGDALQAQIRARVRALRDGSRAAHDALREVG